MQNASSKIVLITGAASGLGLELSKVFIEKGHQVIMADLQIEKLEQEAAALGQNALAYELDVTSWNSVEQLVKTIHKDFQGLDILINNAGITHRSLAQKTDIHVIEKVMAVDYFGPVMLAQACLPLLSQSKGRIINIGSMAGWMPVLGRAGYCAAKSALHQYFEVMRCEVSRLNVKVMMVYPSFLNTPIETNALSGTGEKAKHQRSMIGRMGNASELAERIYSAHAKQKERFFPDTFTFFASVLYKLAPKTFLRSMTKKFASELDQ